MNILQILRNEAELLLFCKFKPNFIFLALKIFLNWNSSEFVHSYEIFLFLWSYRILNYLTLWSRLKKPWKKDSVQIPMHQPASNVSKHIFKICLQEKVIWLFFDNLFSVQAEIDFKNQTLNQGCQFVSTLHFISP